VRLFGDIKETLTVSQLEEFFVIIWRYDTHNEPTVRCF
jgi:hypothetical protein